MGVHLRGCIQLDVCLSRYGACVIPCTSCLPHSANTVKTNKILG